MKKIYKKPETEVVKLRLSDSVLQDVFDSTSKGGTAEGTPAKEFYFWYDDEADTNPNWEEEYEEY